jgi:myo-inositol-1(or 4)-monophosphatase
MADILRQELDIAIEAAHAGANELLGRFRGQLTETIKAHAGDVATEADLAAERAILAVIQRAFPDDAVFGEETGQSGDSDRVWVIDPLDGTAHFARGRGDWSVSIALSDVDGPRVAVIYDPLSDEEWTAVRGGGVQLNDITVPRPAVRPFSHAHMTANSPVRLPDDQRRLTTLNAFREVAMVRSGASGALALAYLAAGRLDLVAYELDTLGRYDVEAGMLMVREQGMFADWLEPAGAGLPRRFVAGPHEHVVRWRQLTER